MNPPLILAGLALAGLCGWNAAILLRGGEVVSRNGRPIDEVGRRRRAGAALGLTACGVVIAVIGLFHR